MSSALYCQTYNLVGTVKDSTDVPLIGATVILLNPTDSLMEGFGISNPQGKFSIDNVKKGIYTLQITYIGYGTFENSITVKGEEEKLDLGEIRLGNDDTLLDAVEIKGRFIPISIKKDTVEYNADAYRVRPNASVEDLLKKMPGIEIDKDGAITAQGEEVNKVTVDGKKFFGNDPKAATKNLPADAVQKVQVIDEKSKNAQFSGVSDGNDTKTINLELKEDKKKGYFGQAKAGYGTTNRLDSKLNINSFNKKLQLSGIVGFNNINDNGFSFNDFQTLSGGGMRMRGGFNSPIGLNFGDKGYGDSENLNGGINLNYDLGKKQNFNLSYYLVNTDNKVVNSNLTETTLPSLSFISDSENFSHSVRTNHVVSSSLELKMDSTQQLDIDFGFSLGDNNVNDQEEELLSRSSGVQTSQTATLQNSKNANTEIEGSVDYNLRLGKKGRVLSIRGDYSTNANIDSLDIHQEILAPEDIAELKLNQYQLDTTETKNIKVEIGYKEPLGKNNYLDIGYLRRNYNSDRVRDFLNKNPFDRDIDLSGASNNSTDYDQYKVAYTLDKIKYQITAGVKYHIAHLDNEEFKFDNSGALVHDDINTLQGRSFGALLPSLSMRLLDKALRISYTTSLDEPSLSDLQTIVDNTDPNNITLGNSSLKPEYEHRMSVRYHKFDRFTFRNVFSSLTYTYTKNNIIDSTSVSNRLVTTSKPINGSGSHRVNGYISLGAPINPLKVKARISGNGAVNIRDNYSNNQLDKVTQWSPSLKFELENLNNDYFTIVGYTRTTWNYNIYDLNSELNSRLLTQTYGAELIIELGKGIVFDTEIDYFNYFNQGEKYNDYALWNMSISKTFMDNRLTTSIKAFDLLDQNNGVDVLQTSTSLSQSTSNALQRYFMFSLNYKFSSFGGAGPETKNHIFIHK